METPRALPKFVPLPLRVFALPCMQHMLALYVTTHPHLPKGQLSSAARE